MQSITDLAPKYIGKRIRVEERGNSQVGTFAGMSTETTYEQLLFQRQPIPYLDTVNVEFTSGHITVGPDGTFEVLDK